MARSSEVGKEGEVMTTFRCDIHDTPLDEDGICLDCEEEERLELEILGLQAEAEEEARAREEYEWSMARDRY